jgi:PAS domain S-box-containing protein
MKSEIINVGEIEEIIIAYANGELHRRLKISEARDERDTIVAGINMLGEELENTTISRDYFMNIYNSVSEILIIIDVEGKIVDLNLAAETILSKSLKDILYVDIGSLISERFLFLQKEIHEVLNSGETYFPFEAALLTNSKTEIPVSCSLSKIIDRFNHNKGYLFIAKDISEQKNKEKNDLRIVIAAQEKERKRLANDLHDSLGQEMNVY